MAVSAFAIFALGMAPAKADVVVSAANPSLCLDVNASNNQVILWGCHGGANQNFFRLAQYGQQVYNNLCLDFEGVGNTQQGSGLQMRGCDANKRSQRWLLVSNPADPNVGRFRNEEGWCINILGGNQNARQGVRPGAWTCQTGRAANDMWGSGSVRAAASVGLPPQAVQALMNPGAVVAPGGNIVAAGGGNIVAAGGGNIVAAGGGNIIQMNGGAIVAAGGGN